MIEVEVHQQLRAFLREREDVAWPHHLTMARLVARALRLGRNRGSGAGGVEVSIQRRTHNISDRTPTRAAPPVPSA